MSSTSKHTWKQIALLFPANEYEKNIATELFREYETKGHLNRPISELLCLELPVIANFFYRVMKMHSCESPILRRRDTRWMNEFDYTLVNIRGIALGNKPGNFLLASLFLATLRTKGIILNPVTHGLSEDIESLESHVALREELVDCRAQDAGITPDLQMMAFCEAAHLLGLVLGYELDYRVAPLAGVVLNKPEFFLWSHKDRCPSDEETQEQLRSRVRKLIASVKKTDALSYRENCRSILADASLAPMLSADGSGRTPLSLRELTQDGSLGAIREEAITYWGRIFDTWRDRYGFDFLVLRGTASEDDNKREVPDEALIWKMAESARQFGVRRNIGVIAEADSEYVEHYGLRGIHMVLSKDENTILDEAWFQKVFDLDEQLHRINLGRKLKFSVPMLVDPGESDSQEERERMLIRRFIARFFGIGSSRRPLLETMGAIECAWGYKRSLKKSVGLEWMPNIAGAKKARCIDDVALVFKTLVADGKLFEKYLDAKMAWWLIRSKSSILLAVVSVENHLGLLPSPVQIDYSKYLKKTESKMIYEFDFHEKRGKLQLNADTILNTGIIPYRGFRLYSIA